MAQKQTISEYEEIRLKNIEDNKAVLAKLMQEVKAVIRTPVKATRRKRTYKQSLCNSVPLRQNPSRTCRPKSLQVDILDKKRRRTSLGSTESESSNAPATSHVQHLVVKFGSFSKFSSSSQTQANNVDTDILQVFDEESDDDENDINNNQNNSSDTDSEDWMSLDHACKQRKLSSVERDVTVSVTEDDLKRVATYVSDKKYDAEFGSTCHQCRQKTDDMKTICRSPACYGVRGQFCGPCLRNRYGEDARHALMNMEWLCPPCRGICNCSFCRRGAGKSSTGILIHLARENGFSDVNSYLQSLKRK